MSTITVPDPVLSAPPVANREDAGAPPIPGGDEFSYQPVPTLVPVSMAFAALSILAFLWDALTVIPLMGATLGWTALRQIARAKGLYGGRAMAQGSVSACLFATVASAAFHVYIYQTEVPEGLKRVNFAQDISAKDIRVINGAKVFDDEVKQLEGQRVFLKGFMYPTGQTTNLKSFVLCKDSGVCCFGGQPKETDMIEVDMQDNAGTANHMTGLVAVGGIFHIEEVNGPAGLHPVYRLECTYFSQAKSGY